MHSDKKLSSMTGFFVNYQFLVFPVSQIPACNNCCSNTTYKEINNPRRSTKSSWNLGENALCDRDLKLGWYRFTSFAGGKIPERMVAPDHCGTRAPVWLNGRHPTKMGENVVRQACVNKLGLDNGCWEFFDINIMNCGDYFVYYLRPPDYCSVAYCAGKQSNKFRFVSIIFPLTGSLPVHSLDLIHRNYFDRIHEAMPLWKRRRIPELFRYVIRLQNVG